MTQSIDPKGGITGFSYDTNGNLLGLTDADSHTTSWTYDNMDRVQMRTDPVLRQESFTYDLMGNLASHTDRKGQVTTFGYDPLNRLSFVGYNTVVNAGVTSYASTTSYQYDAGNRMTQAVDSAGGTITDAYDNLDRLTSETTPQGSISYGYDLAGRRTSMNVAGQPVVNYTYDNANRLTQIAQGATTVGFSYDVADRRSTLTLSNGVNVTYSYDNDSRLTGITYNFGATLLGNLGYSYDSLGRRTQVSGSFARTGFPGAVASATYDAANELTNWNGALISYDLNGNMLSDGSNAFTWNARNQVASLNGRNLQYDAYGRRIQNSLGTAFLYDGANAAQELSGGTPTANLLSGGIDEWFSWTDSSGTVTPLQDALGSTLALVDSGGNLVTQYSYDPFGDTTFSGVASSNPSQYTGRENEGNGLYFYRARYYSSLLGRFINEDPAEDGLNFYAYADSDPVNLVDPFGLSTQPIQPPASPGPQLVKNISKAAASGSRFLPQGAGEWGLAGFLAAFDGYVAYQDYQAVQAFNGENAAYDAEMQQIVFYNQAMMAHPPRPLAGRYTQAQQRRNEWLRYKDVCHGQVPDSGDPCSNLSRNIDRVNRCIKLRQDFDQKWGTSHSTAISQALNELQELKSDYDKNCTSQTW